MKSFNLRLIVLPIIKPVFLKLYVTYQFVDEINAVYRHYTSFIAYYIIR